MNIYSKDYSLNSDTKMAKLLNSTDNDIAIISNNSVADSGIQYTNLATLTGTQILSNKSLSDSTTYIVDDTDITKKAQFEASGITTGTTKTLTIPNKSGTLALLDDARMTDWVLTNSYKQNDRCYWKGILCQANSDILANIAFAWGINGATWSPVIGYGYTWKGIFSNTSTYAVNDIIVSSTTGTIIYRCGIAIIVASINYEPVSGINRNFFIPTSLGSIQEFVGATSTSNGQAGLIPATTISQGLNIVTGQGFKSQKDIVPTFASVNTPVDFYIGDRAFYYGVLVEATANVMSGTALNWNSWKPAICSDGTFKWRGTFLATSTYNVNDIVTKNAVDTTFYRCMTAITTASTNFDPSTGLNRHYWQPMTQANTNVFSPATASLNGQSGLVPAPLVGQHNAILKGNGWGMSIYKGTVTIGDVGGTSGVLPTSGDITSASATASPTIDITINHPSVSANAIYNITIENMGNELYANDITQVEFTRISTSQIRVYFEETSSSVQNIKLNIMIFD